MSHQLKLPTLLVISENPTIRFWVKKQLDNKFFVIQAESRSEAISALTGKLDFIIIDDQMEGVDPLELTKDLKTLTQKHLTPILLITGKLKKTFREKAKEYGVADFLSDQLDPNELQTRIDANLKNAKSRNKTESLALSIKGIGATNAPSLQNKIILDDRAVRLFAIARQTHTLVGILLIRLDGEKGKEELLEFLKKILREHDALLQTKQGHYLLLLAGSPLDKGELVAKKLQAKLEEKLKLAVSIVIQSMPGTGKDLQDLIEKGEEILKNHPNKNLLVAHAD